MLLKAGLFETAWSLTLFALETTPGANRNFSQVGIEPKPYGIKNFADAGYETHLTGASSITLTTDVGSATWCGSCMGTLVDAWHASCVLALSFFSASLIRFCRQDLAARM